MSEAAYGLLLEFDSAEALLDATRRAHAHGMRELEAYSPFPIEGLAEALGTSRNRVPLLVLVGGILGAVFGYFIQYYSAVIDYPINVGGRPYHSWPAFIPVAVELIILGAALAGVIGTLVLNGLPRFHHPVFNAARFERASRDRFFLCVKAIDPRYTEQDTRRFLEELRPLAISEVER